MKMSVADLALDLSSSFHLVFTMYIGFGVGFLGGCTSRGYVVQCRQHVAPVKASPRYYTSFDVVNFLAAVYQGPRLPSTEMLFLPVDKDIS